MYCTPRKFCKLECTTRDANPTRSEVQRRLGASLAQVFFDYSHQEAVKLLDPTPTAEPSQQSCCASQDSQLKTDVKEMWEKRQEILKSYLHSDILALGKGELKKFQAEIEAATQKKLREEFAEECHMLEAEKRFAVTSNADEIHSAYEEYFKLTQHEFEEKLKIEFKDIDIKHNEELQEAVVNTRMVTTHDVLRKIRPEINYVVTSLYNELKQIHRTQREKIITDFNKIIRKQHLKQDAKIREIERRKMEELSVLRHELEIQNVMNIIYILFMERLRSSSQLQVVYKHFEEKIKALYELIAKQEETMNAMKGKITKYRNKTKMLQEKIDTLITEFQKFINFAFNTLPEHADFLLPLNFSLNSTNKENIKQKKK